MGKVNMASYLILGFAAGGFIMAFNIFSYIRNAHRFPFTATLARPFTKYCVNNSIIPIIFLILYIYYMIIFKMEYEFESVKKIVFDILGFLIGIGIFLFLSFLYFFKTNQDIHFISDLQKQKKAKDDPVKSVLHRKTRFEQFSAESKKWQIESYIGSGFKIKRARSIVHYDDETLLMVFHQNHINAAILEVFAILSILALGWLREISFFAIPAGASILLLFTMFMMVTSALHSWLRGWAPITYIVLFLAINYLSQFEFMNVRNQAYGLNYNTEAKAYNDTAFNFNSSYKYDKLTSLNILNNWKKKNMTETNRKPKLVFINCSGGGLRSSLWTFHVMQQVDSILNGELSKHTHLITGSSGGMIGAAYYRELYLRSQTADINPYDDKYLTNLGQDLLNPVAFTIAINDLYLRLQTFEDGDYEYRKDRGYAFEKQFNKNTEYILDKRLADYKEPEASAIIPMMILSPTIVNDGRRLLISSQEISYLGRNIPEKNINNNATIENIEFRKLFKEQDADNLKFTSALRMNATFPYVLPAVSLPTDPPIEVMDAGIRDNFGIKISLNYIYNFKEWIKYNTSGIVIIQLRDTDKHTVNKDYSLRSMVENLLTPLGSVYSNLTKAQDYNNDELIKYASSWFDGNIDIVSFQMKSNNERKVSLSFHLTTKEKKQITDAIRLSDNQKSIDRLKTLLVE
ncbi:MAG: patatin-like phospholipase family protein [Flavobacteriales bacterium]|nr:patatin-like phospholipase family protein [Flavobacteriales bacterium]